KRFGFIRGTKQKYVGVFGIEYKGIELAVLGCTGCHSGRAAGITIPGLGNKTIDPYQIGKDLIRIQSVWQVAIQDKIKKNPDYAYIHSKAMNFARVLSNSDISNLTRGLVADSLIKTFFYKDQGVPWGAELKRMQVKVPFLWGFAEKRPEGVFADGSLNSENYAWAFGAELMASDSGEHMRASLPKLRHLVDNVIGHLQPPKYPFEIDQEKALRGEKLVQKNCFGCHGSHKRDSDGFPIYEAPRLVDQAYVGTDDHRLDYGNALWVDLAEQGSVSDLIFFNKSLFNYGYYAPKLWGVWSRFPYLHNGSVPTLYHLMLPPKERPEVFSMEEAGEKHRYDKKWGGLTTYRSSLVIAAKKAQALLGDRDLYYIERPEHSNRGHYFQFMESFTREDRLSVIEYLKTL
ncbi:MAG: hypothetical protein AAF203_10980, partial [Pseudomonadota bacterium]